MKKFTTKKKILKKKNFRIDFSILLLSPNNLDFDMASTESECLGGSIDTLVILNLLIYEYRVSFHLFVSSLISFSKVCHYTCLSSPGLSLFLSVLFLFW